MKYKPGVSLFGLRAEMLWAIDIIDRVGRDSQYEPTITSGVDGVHSPTSLHYDGRAVDIRTNDMPFEPSAFVAQLVERLPSDFDVVLLYEKEDNEHIHVEWQPKRVVV